MKNNFIGRKVAIAAFYNEKREVLLQDRKKISKRGEEWAFFGGGIHERETKEQALIREMKEELGFKIKEFEYIGDCVTKFEDDYTVIRKIFASPIPENLLALKVSEGGGMKIFSIDEAKKLKLVPGDEKIFGMLEKYLKNKNESQASSNLGS